MKTPKPLKVLVTNHERTVNKKGDPMTVVTLITKSGRPLKEYCSNQSQLEPWVIGTQHTVLAIPNGNYWDITRVDPTQVDALAAFLES